MLEMGGARKVLEPRFVLSNCLVNCGTEIFIKALSNLSCRNRRKKDEIERNSYSCSV